MSYNGSMKIILGADHRGYALKQQLVEYLLHDGYEVIDVGAKQLETDDDFVDYAIDAIEMISSVNDRVILLCGSGHGMEMVANRYASVRAILGFNSSVVAQGRQHEDANVLSIPADWIEYEEAVKLIEIFLHTNYQAGEAYERRLKKLAQLKVGQN